jgi:hypothetical protein
MDLRCEWDSQAQPLTTASYYISDEPAVCRVLCEAWRQPSLSLPPLATHFWCFYSLSSLRADTASGFAALLLFPKHQSHLWTHLIEILQWLPIAVGVRYRRLSDSTWSCIRIGPNGTFNLLSHRLPWHGSFSLLLATCFFLVFLTFARTDHPWAWGWVSRLSCYVEFLNIEFGWH